MRHWCPNQPLPAPPNSRCHQVLKLEAGAQGPEVLGASVFGHNDAYCRLQPFIRNWRAATAARATAAAPAAPAGTPAVAAGSPGASAATPQQAGGAAMPSSEGPRGRSQCPTPAAGTAAAGGSPGRGTSIPQPYLVSVDVTRAFDNVDIPLLLGLVQPLLRHEEYLVLKYTEASCCACCAAPCCAMLSSCCAVREVCVHMWH